MSIDLVEMITSRSMNWFTEMMPIWFHNKYLLIVIIIIIVLSSLAGNATLARWWWNRE